VIQQKSRAILAAFPQFNFPKDTFSGFSGRFMRVFLEKHLAKLSLQPYLMVW
jgi:hypothetical protein